MAVNRNIACNSNSLIAAREDIAGETREPNKAVLSSDEFPILRSFPDLQRDGGTVSEGEPLLAVQVQSAAPGAAAASRGRSSAAPADDAAS